ncbi:MAG: arginase family protein [Patescibacteria group bacterium]
MDSIIQRKNLKFVDALILGVPFYNHFYKKGQRNGLRRVGEVLDLDLELFDRFVRLEPAHDFRIGFKLMKKNRFKGKSAEEVINLINDEKRRFKDIFVLLIGGDHSISIAPFKYFSARARNITILQIDAHLDMRNNDADYMEKASKYAHSTLMRRAFDFGYKTVQVGIRTYAKNEYDLVTEKELSVFEWGRGPIPYIASILKAIKTNDVYLTIDIDGIDPAHMPATGTPVPGGLEWSYTNKLIRELFKEKNVVGADIMEIGSREDETLTEYGVAQLCYSIISYKLLKERGKLRFYE